MKKIDSWFINWWRVRGKDKRQFLALLLVFLGITFPFLLVTYVDSYNRGDVEVFRAWADCWSQQIYITCRPQIPNYPEIPNYPAIGLTLSAGAIQAIGSLFDITNTNTLDIVFRYYLAFFDSLNFLLFIWLTRLMQFRQPIAIAAIVLAMPSTWAGGAVWGQIDNISLFFGLLSCLAFFQVWSDNNKANIWKKEIWVLFGVWNLSLYLLSKQLAIFSLPFFLILFGITGYYLVRDRGMLALIFAIAFFLFSFYSLDTLLEVLPQFYHSSSWFIWQEGSQHGDNISGNGFNLWMFLGRDMWSSSHAPFLTLQMGNWRRDLSPYQIGIFLYSIFVAFLLFTGFQTIWRVFKHQVDRKQKDRIVAFLIAFLCLFHGLLHLGFNVFLTGTHERYLYLGYPFLLIPVAWFYLNYEACSWRLVVFCFLAAAAYGGFVFSIIGSLPDWLFPLRRHEFLASIHLFLLLLLLDLWMGIRQFARKIG